MSQPSYLSEPHVQFLSRSLDEMRSGLLRVPRFQRRALVWNVDRRLELLRSIRDGIPIGSILIWRTGLKLASLENLGPHKLAFPSDRAFVQQYILDGLQRLSALYAALTPIDKTSTETDPREMMDEEWQYETYFDLEQGDFVMLPFNETPEKSHLPLSSFLDNVRYRKALRRLPDSHADRWIETADRVSGAFQEYKIAIVPVVGDDLDLATRTFQLVNSQGTPMSYAYMVHARTWSTSFDLQEQMDRIRNEKLEPLGWVDVPDERILDACKACIGLDFYATEAEELSKKLRSDAGLLERTVDAMVRAVTFLRETCGVSGPKVLPYAHHLTLLTMAFFRCSDPTLAVRELLEAWFWLSTSGTSLTGISGFRMFKVCQELARLVDGNSQQWPGGVPFRWKPLPEGADFRTVRTKSVALLLARQAGAAAVAALGREGPDALVPILPRRTPGLSAKHFGWLGNRAICEPQEAERLARALLAPDPTHQMTSDLAKEHKLSPQALLSLPQDPNGFVVQRQLVLAELELEHIVRMGIRFGFSEAMFR